MRTEIVSWLEYCVESLVEDLGGNKEAIILVKTFITQYELKTLRILESKKNLKNSLQFQYLKNKLRTQFRQPPKKEISFSTPAQNIDLIFWPFQKMHLEVQKNIYQSFVNNPSLTTGIFSHNGPVDDQLGKESLPGYIALDRNNQFWLDFKKDENYDSILTSVKKLPKLNIHNQHVDFKKVLLTCWNEWYWLYDLTVRVFRQLMENYRPRGIFVGNNITLAGNIISHLAKKQGVKIFCIMHGRLNNYIELSQFDYYYLFGNKDKSQLLKKGIPASKLIVSGSPKIDQFFGKNKDSISEEKKLRVLVALSGPGHSISTSHHFQILEKLQKAAKEHPRFEFNFKLHKKDSLSYYEEIKKLENVHVFEYGDRTVSSNIYDWLLKSELLITGASTSALDAMVMGVPVLTIDLQAQLKNVPFIKEGQTFHATDFESLKNGLQEVSTKGENYRKHLDLVRKNISEIFTQPEQGTVNLINAHINKVLNEA